ncbi:MAG: dicarboxylate/amino acid:cation symporter, partial [Desulfobacterales bacterium]|nr:dicarboxylate/amino acid:cation symporter [Desulfobacterales bacterium]
MGKKLIKNLGVQILVAMVLGILAGTLLGGKAVMFKPLGDVFINLIKMLVIPLVAVSVTSGAASLGNAKSAGKLGISTFGFYLGTTAVAVVIGLVFGEVFQPGAGLDITKVQQWFSLEKAGSATPPEFWHLILSLIPTNPIQAFTQGNILQTLFFCLFLGIGIGNLAPEKKDFLLRLFDTLTEALIWMIKVVMLVAPFGVFALMASATGTFGYDILGLVVKLLVVYVGAILLHGFGFYPLVLKLFSKMSVRRFLSKIYKPQVVALSTASSMATMPMTFETCEDELGVSKE